MIKHNQSLQNQSFNGFGGLMVLAAIYISAIPLAAFHGSKLLQIGSLTFDAGLFTFAFTFFVTDIISEVYGKKTARYMILCGLVALFMSIITTKIALFMPSSSDWELTKEFDAILGTGSRVMVAALVAFVTSQLVDITVFSWIRKRTGEKYLWLRNNISTLAGGLMDAIFFSTIAFYGVYPVLPIIASAYVARIIISIADTPFVYLGVYILRRFYTPSEEKYATQSSPSATG